MPWYVYEPEKPVPRVIGLNANDAINVLKDADLAPVIGDTTYDEKYPRGSVIYQRPNAGEIVKINRRIYLFISGGEPTVTVPVLIGKSIRDAKFSLERLGLNLGKIDSVASSNPSNMIFDQQFSAGTSLKKGDFVGVSLSIGNNDSGIIVPNLIGKSLTEAEKILSDSTLKVGKINYQPSVSLLPNTILDQYPSNGIRVTSGSSIDLFLTKPSDTENRQ
ncbi:MAG: PASTA domain-containing protein [Ignavibacteriaceae bacterium]